MGYTHYWKHGEINHIDWAGFSCDVHVISKYVTGRGIPLTNGEGDEGSVPTISTEFVVFNGPGDEAYETFAIERKGDERFSFCKTERRPYDLAVCLSLIALKRRCNRDVEVTSDGNESDWSEAIVAAEVIFGIPQKNIYFDGDGKLGIVR